MRCRAQTVDKVLSTVFRLSKKAGAAGLQTADKGAVFERKQPLNA